MRRAQLLNTAYRMLNEGCTGTEAVERLSKQCDLSQRQAYRYVREAQAISAPAEVPETPVAVTLKLPRSVLDALRAPRYEQRPFDGHDRVARSGGVLAGHASTWLIAERGTTSTLKAFSTVSALTSSCRPMRSCRPIMPAGPRP